MKNKIIYIFSALAFGLLLFYWFQLRPAQIKHECSWVKHHRDAIPEKKGKTEAQLKEEGQLKVCPTLQPNRDSLSGNFLDMMNNRRSSIYCESDNQDIIKKYSPQKYTPAKDWQEKATDKEYKFCLRDKGL